ncbi:MAG: S1C family serine protease [Microbacterium sp.]
MSAQNSSHAHPAPETRAFATVETVTAPWYLRKAPMACAVVGLTLASAFALGVPAVAAVSTAQSMSNAAATATQEQAADATTPAWTPARPEGSPGGTTPGGTTVQQGAATTQEAAEVADADEATGVVLIDTDLAYAGAEGAGTGMVLSSDGLILTNNHVVEGATEIQVTVASTGETYTASLVGTDAEDDVAVLQLEGASGLDTVTIDEDDEAVGDAVTAVGNADGDGMLMAADGEITDLESTVTTQASGVVDAESLDGMIELSADVVSGDSGGALLDDEGEVIGMTTAASSGSPVVTAYAIPIEDALAIAEQITSGDESDGVTIGYPAFLGIYTADGASGATIAGVLEGTPAADAGLTQGDTVTAVDGAAVASAEELTTVLEGYDPGDTVALTYTDASGASQSASVTLTEGAA